MRCTSDRPLATRVVRSRLVKGGHRVDHMTHKMVESTTTSYQKEDGCARDNDKDLRVCFLVTHVNLVVQYLVYKF